MKIRWEGGLEKALKEAELLVLACRATGGYKWRKMIPLSDTELEKVCIQAAGHLRGMAMALYVAEGMLREPAPSIHARWDEYNERLADAVRLQWEKGGAAEAQGKP